MMMWLGIVQKGRVMENKRERGKYETRNFREE
jgi:hypothetical protein